MSKEEEPEAEIRQVGVAAKEKMSVGCAGGHEYDRC